MKGDDMFKYKTVVELGFQRDDYSDEVHFDTHGYHPFHMRLVVQVDIVNKEKTELYWDQITHKVTLTRYSSEEGNILGQLKIFNLTQLKDTIKFYKNENKNG